MLFEAIWLSSKRKKVKRFQEPYLLPELTRALPWTHWRGLQCLLTSSFILCLFWNLFSHYTRNITLEKSIFYQQTDINKAVSNFIIKSLYTYIWNKYRYENCYEKSAWSISAFSKKLIFETLKPWLTKSNQIIKFNNCVRCSFFVLRDSFPQKNKLFVRRESVFSSNSLFQLL